MSRWNHNRLSVSARQVVSPTASDVPIAPNTSKPLHPIGSEVLVHGVAPITAE